jgi:predicted nucleic acid-binding Zn ribbon protein
VPGDKVVDTVDNSEIPGDGGLFRPPGALEPPPGTTRSGHSVPSPGDSGSPGGTAGERRGYDIARDALAAAREASAGKAAAKAAERGARKPAGNRGRRRRWSGPGPDDRDPQMFGRLVSRVSLDRGWSSRLTDATVMGRWPTLVGAEIADHCTPLSLRDGELVLQAESTAWATQLRTLQRQILGRLADAVGRDVVKRIRVVGPSGPSWRHGPRSVRGRGPRDTYG